MPSSEDIKVQMEGTAGERPYRVGQENTDRMRGLIGLGRNQQDTLAQQKAMSGGGGGARSATAPTGGDPTTSYDPTKEKPKPGDLWSQLAFWDPNNKALKTIADLFGGMAKETLDKGPLGTYLLGRNADYNAAMAQPPGPARDQARLDEMKRQTQGAVLGSMGNEPLLGPGGVLGAKGQVEGGAILNKWKMPGPQPSSESMAMSGAISERPFGGTAHPPELKPFGNRFPTFNQMQGVKADEYGIIRQGAALRQALERFGKDTGYEDWYHTQLSMREKESIGNGGGFKGIGAANMNYFLGHPQVVIGKNSPEYIDHTIQSINDVTSALEKAPKMPHDIETIRIVQQSAVERIMKEGQIGGIMTWRPFMSTRMDHQETLVANGIMHIGVPKGTTGAYIEFLAPGMDESEFLLQRGTRLRLVHIDANNAAASSGGWTGTTHFYLVVEDQPDLFTMSSEDFPSIWRNK